MYFTVKKRMMILVLCFFFTLPIRAYAILDFVRTISFNAESLSRGGATVAVPDNPGSLNINPALISAIPSQAADIGFLFIMPDMEVQYDGTGGRQHTSTDKETFLWAPEISYSSRIQDSPWSWGISLATPDGIGTEYNIESKYFGQVNALSEFIHLRLGPTVAYQLSPDLSLGFRLGIDYMTLDFRMPLGLANIDVGKCDGWGLSGAFGLFYKPSERWQFGLYYETPTFMQDLKSQDSDASIELMTQAGPVTFSGLETTVNDLQSPQSFGIGAAFSPSKEWRFSADIKYLNWNRTWDALEFEFSGPGPTEAGLPSAFTFPTEINDQITIALGAEYFIGEQWRLGIGYHYNDDAIDDNYLNYIIPAEVAHTLTAGFSYQLVKNARLSLSYAYCIMDSPQAGSHHGYDQSLEQQLGLPAGMLGTELSGAEADYAAHALQISMMFNW